MGMGFAPTWLRQVSPPPASQNHFNHCVLGRLTTVLWMKSLVWLFCHIYQVYLSRCLKVLQPISRNVAVH